MHKKENNNNNVASIDNNPQIYTAREITSQAFY